MALSASYIFTRTDYALMTVALNRRRLLHRVIRAAGFVLAALFVGVWFGSNSNEDYLATLLDILKAIGSGEVPVWFYAIYMIVAAIPLCSHWIAGLFAYLSFWRLPTGGLRHEVELGETEVAITAPNMASTIKWAAISKVIEERTFFLLSLKNRQSVLLPKRAFPDDTSYAQALAFARSHADMVPR